MNFDITEQKEIIIIHLKGILIGQHQIVNIADEIENKIADEKTHFIAELSDVQLINSTGLGVLLNILTKARNAIEEVAKSGNYTYIFDKSIGSILYANESENILPQVKKKLGL